MLHAEDTGMSNGTDGAKLDFGEGRSMHTLGLTSVREQRVVVRVVVELVPQADGELLEVWE